MRQQFALSGILAAYVFGGLIYPYAHIHTHSCSHAHTSQQLTETQQVVQHGSHIHCHHVHSSTEEHQDRHQHSQDHSHSECPACELLWMAQFAPDLPTIVENYAVIWLESPAPAMVAIRTDASLPLLRGPPVLA